MLALAGWVLEGQLDVQRRGLEEGLGDLDWGDVGEDVGGRKVERGVRGVVHNLESLGRVIKVSDPVQQSITTLSSLSTRTMGNNPNKAGMLALERIENHQHLNPPVGQTLQ